MQHQSDVSAIVAAALTDAALTGPEDPAAAVLIPSHARALVTFTALTPGIAAGLEEAAEVYRQLDPSAVWTTHTPSGSPIRRNHVIATVDASLRAVLMGRPVAVGFLAFLSGVASTVNDLESVVSHTDVVLVDTPDTLPNLHRSSQRAALHGGAVPFRRGPFDTAFISAEHVAITGSFSAAADLVRASAPFQKVIIEITTLEGMTDALAAHPDIIALRDFPEEHLREAIFINSTQALLMYTGEVHRDNIVGLAETGVDYISVAPALSRPDPFAVDVTTTRIVA